MKRKSQVKLSQKEKSELFEAFYEGGNDYTPSERAKREMNSDIRRNRQKKFSPNGEE